MNETVPKYIIDLRDHLDNRIDKLTADIVTTTSNGFTAVQKQINSLENRFDGLETRFNCLETKFDALVYRVDNIENVMVTKEDIKDIATKQDIKEIHAVIGSYEVRAQNVEQILLKEHKPRIIDLEKEVFA